MLVSTIYFPYARDTVRTLTKADISVMPQYQAVIFQMKTEMPDCKIAVNIRLGSITITLE